MRWTLSICLIVAWEAGVPAAQEPPRHGGNAAVAPFACAQPGDEHGSARSRRPLLHLRAAAYDYVGVASELRFAQGIVEERFARAGIAIDWVPCTEAASVAYVNILPAEMAARNPMSHSAMGFSWIGTRTASVAYARVVKTAVVHRMTPAHLLGYVMAHELGHLLLPPRSHSATGLMAENFDLQQVRMKQLEFDRAQAMAMRAALMDPAGVFATR